MKPGLTLEALLREVIRQNSVKKDFVANTQQNVRMVPMADFPKGVAVVLQKEGAAELERFEITENAHRQIAGRIGIPWKYYDRMLNDHTDLVLKNVNTLFEREPASRLFRALDGKLRAFLSDRYLRIDNHQILEATLPAIVKGDVATTLLSSHVGENRMDLKVMFTDDRFAQEITSKTRTGETRVVRPGFRMTNSETGHGKLRIKGFFYDGYCLNGCIYGLIDAFEFSRTHLGGQLIEGVDFEILSEETKRLEDDVIVSHVKDVINALATPEFAQQMGDALREAAATDEVKKPLAAVNLAVKELDLVEAEKEAVLTTFLQDGDYTKWGLASAVTSVANRESTTLDRASEIEDIGAQILTMGLRDWNRYVNAELQEAA